MTQTFKEHVNVVLTVNALPVPTIIGPAIVCSNSVGNIYTTEAGMTGYIWTVSSGGTITATWDASGGNGFARRRRRAIHGDGRTRILQHGTRCRPLGVSSSL